MHERSELTDDELWERCRGGQERALGELQRRHAGALHDLVVSLTSDGERAARVTQAVFREAWDRRREAVEPGRVSAWLLGIAVEVLHGPVADTPPLAP
jgi:DNA-directed RNA polymerase specialized sigma24 family protein